jgi:hypothetical protein
MGVEERGGEEVCETNLDGFVFQNTEVATDED